MGLLWTTTLLMDTWHRPRAGSFTLATLSRCSFSSFYSLLGELLDKQLLELLLPGVRRRQANVVLADKGTDIRNGMLPTIVWVCMPTAVGLGFAVQRMERGVENVFWDAHDNTVIVSIASSVLVGIIARVTRIRSNVPGHSEWFLRR